MNEVTNERTKRRYLKWAAEYVLQILEIRMFCINYLCFMCTYARATKI